MTQRNIGTIPAIVAVEEEIARHDSSAPPELGSKVDEQSSWTRTIRARREVELDGDQLQRQLDAISSKLQQVFENQTQNTTNGYTLDSFTVKLTIKGTGRVYLVAEVGAEASLELKFTRPA